MSNSLTPIQNLEEHVRLITTVLQERTHAFGYANVTYRLEQLEKENGAMEIVGFTFWNEWGKRVTPGFFHAPDCFDAPYDVVERFADLVVHLVLNEIGLRMHQEVSYLYEWNGRLYAQKTLQKESLTEAVLIKHTQIPQTMAEGLFGCADGLWLVNGEDKQFITLFDVCVPDDEIV